MQLSELIKMDLNELNMLRTQVTKAINLKATQSFFVGDQVKIDSPKARGLYTIRKVNRKTATLTNESGLRVRASLSMLISA